MRIVVSEFVSLDGIAEAPGPGEDYEHAGWTFRWHNQEIEEDKRRSSSPPMPCCSAA